jgi:hypothetical protein
MNGLAQARDQGNIWRHSALPHGEIAGGGIPNPSMTHLFFLPLPAARSDYWQVVSRPLEGGAARDREARRGCGRRARDEGGEWGAGFQPFRDRPKPKPVDRLEPHPHRRKGLDADERYFVLLFLRRYVTWCARRRRYVQMQGAARLFRALRQSPAGSIG